MQVVMADIRAAVELVGKSMEMTLPSRLETPRSPSRSHPRALGPTTYQRHMALLCGARLPNDMMQIRGGKIQKAFVNLPLTMRIQVNDI